MSQLCVKLRKSKPSLGFLKVYSPWSCRGTALFESVWTIPLLIAATSAIFLAGVKFWNHWNHAWLEEEKKFCEASYTPEEKCQKLYSKTKRRIDLKTFTLRRWLVTSVMPSKVWTLASTSAFASPKPKKILSEQELQERMAQLMLSGPHSIDALENWVDQMAELALDIQEYNKSQGIRNPELDAAIAELQRERAKLKRR